MNEFTMTSGTIKTMETFATTIKRCVELSLGNNYEVMVQEVNKNNGVCLTGVTIKETNSKIAPMIYLESAFEAYKKGRSLASICNEIIQVYKENCTLDAFDEKDITEYERVKDKVCYKLVNAERNQSLLKRVPFIPFHDLAVIFYVEVFQNTEKTGSVTVTNELMELWKKDAFAVIKDAVANTERLHEGVVIHMLDMLEELRNSLFASNEAVFYDINPREAFPLFVATNKERLHGASVILYDGFLEDFADEIDNNFYILPSSTHEVIFVPDHPDMDVQYFKDMVREINIVEVVPQEVLSDSIYYFDRADGLLMKL